MASKFFSNLFGVVDDEPETADYYEDQQPAQQAPAPVPTPAQRVQIKSFRSITPGWLSNQIRLARLS